MGSQKKIEYDIFVIFNKSLDYLRMLYLQSADTCTINYFQNELLCADTYMCLIIGNEDNRYYRTRL